MELDKEEHQAELSKSSQAEMKFTARFKNNTGGNIDLIWKDYDADEVVKRFNLRPGATHIECIFFTHPFIARDCETRQLKSFSYKSTTSVVFEGFQFGVIPNSLVEVSICERKARQPGLGLC